ncbi:MAG TPA: radical SAM protein [Candidatus Eremiobacteraeota bacterium]|nr:radical SAM protein [Candidatus Eremiobacteraeota bacterium]
MKTKFKVCREIVFLKRGRERIIFNAEQVNPIYFPYGGDEVINILEELRKKTPFFSLQEKICPKELFEFLSLHSLIVPEKTENSPPVTGCIECGLTDGQSHQKSLYLLLSQSCNQACIYCLNGRKTYRKDEKLIMSEDIACTAVKSALSTIADHGRMEVVFFGGEPLLNWPLAKKIINYCETELKPANPEKTIAYHLTTNLTIFPDDLIETAKKYNMTFLVDIDGPEEIHNKSRPFVDGRGSFRNTAENIDKLVREGLHVALRATVTSINDSFMMDIAKTHKELGGSGCAFVPLNPVDSDGKLLPLSLCPSPEKFKKGLKEVFHSGLWDVKDLYPFNEYLARLKPFYRNQWGCGAPFGNTPVVTVTGEIYSCIYLVGNKKYKVGHILKNDFPRREVVDYMLSVVDVDYRSKCSKCNFRYLCGGGCPVGIFSIEGHREATGKMKRYVRTIACTVSKTILTELFWHIAKNIYL